MIGIPLGLLYANAGEWFIHKYVLHAWGRHKGTPFSFHWHEHHRACRKGGFLDGDYHRPLRGWHAQTKEAVGVAALAAAHLPLAPVAPFFVATVCYSAANYYRVHKRSHLDPEWARTHLPWHYDHHMGPDQDCNWCVTRPWFDQVMGTRKPYLGTERAARDDARRAARAPRTAPARRAEAA
jgi:sterol desaturase/sphingolipid hydroxylase (fatty acid hydroxylase superfamily)